MGSVDPALRCAGTIWEHLRRAKRFLPNFCSWRLASMRRLARIIPASPLLLVLQSPDRLSTRMWFVDLRNHQRPPAVLLLLVHSVGEETGIRLREICGDSNIG